MISRSHLGIYGIIIDQDKILLVYKARGPYTGTLDLVGGTPEAGETAEQTLVREVCEESGVAVQRATYLTDYIYRCTYKDLQGREIDFTHTAKLYRVDECDAANFNASVHEEDVQGAAWFSVAQLASERLSPIAAHALTLITTDKHFSAAR